jgi:hypothetical protein
MVFLCIHIAAARVDTEIHVPVQVGFLESIQSGVEESEYEREWKSDGNRRASTGIDFLGEMELGDGPEMHSTRGVRREMKTLGHVVEF